MPPYFCIIPFINNTLHRLIYLIWEFEEFWCSTLCSFRLHSGLEDWCCLRVPAPPRPCLPGYGATNHHRQCKQKASAYFFGDLGHKSTEIFLYTLGKRNLFVTICFKHRWFPSKYYKWLSFRLDYMMPKLYLIEMLNRWFVFVGGGIFWKTWYFYLPSDF